MKFFKTFLATIMAFSCLSAFTSCNDKNDEPTTPVARTISGSYNGDLQCTVMGNPSNFADCTFTITATDDNTVSVGLPAFGENPMAMPAINVSGVKVTDKDGIATLATTDVSGLTDTGKNYTCTVEGTVDGNTLNIRFNLQYGAMPMPLICSSIAVKL